MSDKNNDVKKNHYKLTHYWEKYNLKWGVVISIWTFFLAMIISVAAELILRNTEILFSFMILLIIIFIGVLSDIVGIAVTSASVKPFHSMAANKVPGAKYAIQLVRNAGPVSNFCNDVVGDICGIISGVAGASIILQMPHLLFPLSKTVLTIVMSGFVASLTVGGKSIGKSIAIDQSEKIVFQAGRFLGFLNRKLNIEVIPNKRAKKRKER